MVLCCWGCVSASSQEQGPLDPKALFREPTALRDQDGRPIVTRRAAGHPAVCDLNADGLPDVLLGCHTSMDTVQAEILVLENVGTKAEPRFRWPPTGSIRVANGDAAERLCSSCGCKGGGTFVVHPVDWNGDGRPDLVVNTMWKRGVLLFLNRGKANGRPAFSEAKKLHAIGTHGKSSGGGDWNNDGIPDLVFPANPYGWALHPGRRTEAGGVQFAAEPAATSRDYRIEGQARWWRYTPYAWNFSGRRAAGSGTVEVVACEEERAKPPRPYAEKRCFLDFSVLDHGTKTARRVGRLATSHAAVTRLALGDLNADGSMDILYAGGVFTKGDETGIHVLYGKVPNISRR
jgi:hypothetical protein